MNTCKDCQTIEYCQHFECCAIKEMEILDSQEEVELPFIEEEDQD
jgi:hypothetical protein